MDSGLAGKVVLVTGGSRGIGKAAAVQFANEGARVFITYANDSRMAAETVEEIRSQGSECHAIRMDLTDRDSIPQAISSIAGSSAGIDVLVNNAVTGDRKPVRIAEGSPDAWLAMIDHNLMSTYLVTRAVVPFMQKGAWGRMVHLSSDVAEDGMPGASSYAASKSGLHGFSRALAVELASANIFSNVVMPGLTLTERNTAEFDPGLLTQFARAVPAKRLGTPEDVASTIVYLGSQANRFVNGEAIRVTGGK
ncbi:SDR family NAD(P)-dependent oxidoreductase [Cohnella nanjingensis]|uniref:SDR family oxidoreductase n=1 Tax=Cohnella nanjingensis TaxID=1387779 RepID=A0A7X0VDZ8_9BACL|nr:SDR family oxidoreductase [Cohnella nanjingensis]MBB6670480.1 SDR family oxidoreductase [Cohnella nanjingensis]